MASTPTDMLIDTRATTHGSFDDGALVACAINDAINSLGNTDRLNQVQRIALDMIALKLGRIVAGDPNHRDHWDDIAGYARLIAQRL